HDLRAARILLGRLNGKLERVIEAQASQEDGGTDQVQPRRFWRRSGLLQTATRIAPASSSTADATRSASAMIVRYGLISSASGNRLESATRSHGMPCTRPYESVTESAAERPMPQPP